MSNKELVRCATNALDLINSFYMWLDTVDRAGGTTSIAGVAKAHKMLNSMRTNRPTVRRLITSPLLAAIIEANKQIEAGYQAEYNKLIEAQEQDDVY